MSEKHRTNLLITNVMYTQLLTIILENEFNKNVIIIDTAGRLAVDEIMMMGAIIEI